MNEIERRIGSVLDVPLPADLQGLRLAYAYGSMSDHPDTQVGAYLSTGDGGWNRQYDSHPPKGADYRWARIHAESDALLTAAAMGNQTDGATLYAPWAACCACAVDILAAEVSLVVVHLERMLLTPPKWKQQVCDGLDMLQRNGVNIQAVIHNFGVTLRVNGEEVTV